jgi:hypothetical protein
MYYEECGAEKFYKYLYKYDKSGNIIVENRITENGFIDIKNTYKYE